MRRVLALVATAVALAAGVAEAQDKVKVGVLKLTSSAVLFASFVEAAVRAIGE
jgi:hypothetical protein